MRDRQTEMYAEGTGEKAAPHGGLTATSSWQRKGTACPRDSRGMQPANTPIQLLTPTSSSRPPER